MFTDADSPVSISLLTDPFEVQQAIYTNHSENEFISIYSIKAQALSIFFSETETYSRGLAKKPSRLLSSVLSLTSLQAFSSTF
jgi:hypothetical protein